MTKKDVWDLLSKEALAVRRKAYAPYSRFKVGAALLSNDDPAQIFCGCNVENSSYGLTICAERNAFASAVAKGCREFRALAIATAADEPAPPCGPCLQVMVEFCDDLPILLLNTKGKTQKTRLSKLLTQPFRFSRRSLGRQG